MEEADVGGCACMGLAEYQYTYTDRAGSKCKYIY